METLSCMDIQKKTLEILENDAELAPYVAAFSIGGEKASRKRYPYVLVARVTDDVEPLCIGRNAPDLHNYLIVIHVGTWHTLAKIACEGNGSDKKGVVQLMDDTVAALYPGDLDGTLKPTLHLVKASHEEVADTGGRSRIATITFRGFRRS